MDILSQYEQENPEASKPQPAWQSSGEYGFFIRLVMRLSGGKIQNETQANYVLFVFIAIAVIISLSLFFNTGPAKFQEDWKPYINQDNQSSRIPK